VGVVIYAANESKSLRSTLRNVEFHHCYDGDTCTFSIHDVHPLLGHRIRIRLADIDAPEINGACEKEREMGLEARDALNEFITSGDSIILEDVKRGNYFRLLAQIGVDGKKASDFMLQSKLAVPYVRNQKDNPWCLDE